MLRTLECFALTWDAAVVYQSQRTAGYQQALNTLHAQGRTFQCSCSRAESQGARLRGHLPRRPDPPRSHRYAGARA